MQRLLCLKQLLSQNPRNLSNTTTSSISSTTCSKHLLSLIKTNPVHSNTSLLLHPSRHLFFHSTSSSSSSHLWVYQKIHGFLLNPILVKQVLLSLLPNNALFKSPPIKALLDSSRVRVGFLSPLQFSRRSFKLNPSFHYHRHSWQSWLRRFTPDGVVLGLIIANVAVFMLWRVADRDFMRKNFMISLDNFRSGRVHTMITSAFSHIEIEHIISNMIGLYFFGTRIARYFGPEFLLKLYLSGAVAGSVFYLVHHAFMSTSAEGKRMSSHDPSRTPGLGASGAVNAIMLLDIFLFPRNTIYVEFIIPVPAILLGIFLIGKDMLRVLEGNSHISGSAHLGGAAVAAVAWARLRRGHF